MLRFLTSKIMWVLLAGTALGMALTLGAEKMDSFTSTDAFCTSCHAMQEYIASSEVYRTSTHQMTTTGVRPGCADCHIPKGLVAATWAHVVNGVSDLYGELRHDYQDPKVWAERRGELAHATRMWMRSNDSATCRSCHEEDAIKPERKRGQKQHEEARELHLTCIDCHYNLVHEPIEPRKEFLKAAEKDG